MFLKSVFNIQNNQRIKILQPSAFSPQPFIFLPLIFFFSLFFLSTLCGQIQEPLPTPPQHYFNDAAGVVSAQVAFQLNTELANFDRKTSNQIVVAIYPQFWSKTSPEDLAQKLYTTWHPGTKKNSNGVLVLVFQKEHIIRIQTGYGLEGALPDALCKRIIDETMAPAFQRGDYASGLSSGLAAIMQATAHEYQGAAHKKKSLSWQRLLFSPFSFFLLIMLCSMIFNRRRSRNGLEPDVPSRGGWWIGGGGFGDGGFGGGDGGGFPGGGGESGGGGAGGSW